MKIPVDKLTRAFKMGASVKKDSDTPVRVSVYLDSSASRFLAETVRDAFVPQTTSGIVRVERLGEERIAPKTDTDVVLVLSCGSDRLESAVQELVIAGAPVCVLAESAVEVPFIEESTPMLGVVAATDKTYLLETLGPLVLDAPTRKRLLRRLCLHAHRGGQSYHHLVRAHQYGDRCAGVFAGRRLSRYGAGAGGHAL